MQFKLTTIATFATLAGLLSVTTAIPDKGLIEGGRKPPPPPKNKPVYRCCKDDQCSTCDDVELQNGCNETHCRLMKMPVCCEFQGLKAKAIKPLPTSPVQKRTNRIRNPADNAGPEAVKFAVPGSPVQDLREGEVNWCRAGQDDPGKDCEKPIGHDPMRHHCCHDDGCTQCVAAEGCSYEYCVPFAYPICCEF